MIAAPLPEVRMRNHLGRRADFTRTSLCFRHVEGKHYTLLDSETLTSFGATLESALVAGGVYHDDQGVYDVQDKFSIIAEELAGVVEQADMELEARCSDNDRTSKAL